MTSDQGLILYVARRSADKSGSPTLNAKELKWILGIILDRQITDEWLKETMSGMLNELKQ
jgi:hypothetical protein